MRQYFIAGVIYLFLLGAVSRGEMEYVCAQEAEIYTTLEQSINETAVLSPETAEYIRKGQMADMLLIGRVIFICFLIVVELVLLNVKKPPVYRKKQRVVSSEYVKSIIKRSRASVIPQVVIRAEHVCMEFDAAVNEYSSIKELMIQTIKGKRRKERYRALNDISFTIQKGNVVGVIGTNGAGKSTLLKIISGALRPSSGVMRVNRRKLQILTLGTGFDMELTGKENVYLNGAIIGYDRKFIDEHYEEIVEFAELQGFMNEKVKNYSSGMVSRLAFAIATIGQPPDILILDEVLSVGDQIFRKKSLKRIQELIHSGSTVLMVSHSTNTIRENCDKAVWLEKGHMIAMGNAKDICDIYDRYDGDFEKLMVRRGSESDTLEWIM